MGLIDTHCHIQSIGVDEPEDFTVKKWRDGKIEDAATVIKNAARAGIDRLICVGTDLADSQRAVNFAIKHDNIWVSVGVHPHEAEKFLASEKAKQELERIIKQARLSKVVAIGECGLDYHYENSPKKKQQELLRFHLEIAKKYDLPLVFHVREAFDDFWKIFDDFEGLRGVVHSFSASLNELEQVLERGLFVGLNGIITFARDEAILEAAKKVPKEKILLETDAPYLAPAPFRGKVCKPEHLHLTAEFLADLRGESVDELAKDTTKNAENLFGIRS